MTMPGYGYVYDDESFKSNKTPDETGLFIANLEDCSKDLVINIEQLNENGGLKAYGIENAHQYVTHCLFSPDGRYVSFLYRATVMNDLDKRWTQMVVYDRDTKKSYFSPTDDMVSHYVWNNKNQIIAYSRLDLSLIHI